MLLLHVLFCYSIWYDFVIKLKEEDEEIKREYKKAAIAFIIAFSFAFAMLMSMVAGGS